ncbi:MAG: hypothetical protein M1840_003988 [Geoglossum simile]|nr:MAG: hypothetical protein M1840_003988 [Geoglossum simile]
MSVIVRERERERRLAPDVYRRPSPPRTLRSFRRYRVNRPFDEQEAYDDLYERERQFELDRRRYSSPYEVESYSRSTEYFSRPQTVIVREEPETVIIRERRPVVVPVREPELVENDIYYERDSRVGRKQEIVYRKERDIEPADSASQWSSDDDLVYIHRETTEGGFRERSPHHGRHLAEGIVAGVGAEEILRHHHKREGRPDRHHKRNVAGAALAGAVGAEALSRVRSNSRHGHHHHRHHHNHHHHKAEDLAKLGLGTAAVAAAVNYGMNRNRDRRSRSRRRRHSVSGTRVYYDDYDSDGRSRSRSRHRGRHLAEAALGTAAAAGLIHHERDKSRRRSYSRSRSHSRHGSSRHRSRSPNHHKLPLAAAAVGTALLAHHEKKKREHEGLDRRSRSRSRSRSVIYSDAGLSSSPRDPGLIEYGDEPVYTNVAGGYGGRRRDADRVGIPLAAGAGYAAGRTTMRGRSRSRSRTRRHERSSSYSSSPSPPVGGNRRSRRSSDHHHGHHLAEAALAAGATGLAAHEIKKSHDRRKAKDHEQRHHAGDPYDERDYPEHAPADYPPSTLSPSPPSSYYPTTNAFPPPPPKPYNPADYPPPPAPDVRDHVPPPPIPLPDPHAYGGVETTERVERIEEGPGDSVSDLASRLTSPEPPKSVTFDLRPHHRAHSYTPPPSIHAERNESPSAASDTTIELPPRFDRQGRPIEDRRSGRGRVGHGDPEGELAFRIGEAVAGVGKVGRVMEKVFRGR